MANERLRSALAAAGLTPQAVGEEVGVDTKTIERWISTGRIPHRANRTALCALLGRDEEYLWPNAVTEVQTRSASHAEFVDIHPNRGAIAVATWHSLLTSAQESIDLLAYAASFFHDTISDFNDLLLEKARAGVRVRLLFGDPKGEAVKLRGQEEGIGDSLSGRCSLSWKYFAPCIGIPGIDARVHDTTLYTSIFRFDDDLFANTHVYGAAANHSPVMHLHRVAGGRLFPHFLDAFTRVWDSAVQADSTTLST